MEKVTQHKRKKKKVGAKEKFSLDKIRTCKKCGAKFTWREKKGAYGQKYCSTQCARSMPKGGGRPESFTDDTVKKLEQAFAIGCPVTEACVYANITTPTFYKFCKVGSKMFNRFMALREHPVLKARGTVVADLGNVDSAFRYLRAKRKNEFSERVETTGADGGAIEMRVTAEDKEKIEKIFEENF